MIGGISKPIYLTTSADPMASGNGAVATATPTASKPRSAAEFAELCRSIAKQPDTEARHRLFDQASNDLLCSLGFSEGVEIFRASVAAYHTNPMGASL